ncbi:MAG: Rpn family recombination-promoting nuclease/putative transposase [Puniceicoccales bacterium]|jgi:predicted transposase/invertase (TIGR01784 family)|nr:Rpn family recombination-promoting nuclease/putative transposase [Puniceicoccales bacterium]
MKTTDTDTTAAAPAPAARAVPAPSAASVMLQGNCERRYIDPTFDAGFKRLFGQEASKELLRDFLNSILPPERQIASLFFRNSERKGASNYERDIVIDLACVTPAGETFIVEMQRVRQKYFLNRIVFYVCEAIRSQDPRLDASLEGAEDKRTEAEIEADIYKLAPVYFVGILNFLCDGIDPQGNPRWFKEEVLIRNIGLYDQNGEPVSNLMQYTLVQMPRFTKTESELVTHTDKWLYFLKHLKSFGDIPGILREPVFEQAFHTAEVAAMTPDERWDYLHARDSVFLSEGVRAQGILEAKAEVRAELTAKLAEVEAAAAAELAAAAAKAEQEKLDMARQMKSKGLSAADIAEITGLTHAEIAAL